MSDIKTIWITGSKGFIGGELVRRLQSLGTYRVVGTDTELSVTDAERLQAFALELKPDIIINSAGISRGATGISNRIKAYETNALGAMNVAIAANTVGAYMVQISTDDVYPQRMAEPANEFDTPHPETPYGKSKRAGEVMVRDAAPDNSLIVRSSWVYSIYGGIVKEAVECIKAGKPFEARTDQYASPTSIATYTNFIIKAIEKRATGVLQEKTKQLRAFLQNLQLNYLRGKSRNATSKITMEIKHVLRSLLVKVTSRCYMATI